MYTGGGIKTKRLMMLDGKPGIMVSTGYDSSWSMTHSRSGIARLDWLISVTITKAPKQHETVDG